MEGWKRKERVFRKMRDVRMKVCFIYEENSSIYTQNLQTFGQKWPTHTLHFASLYSADTRKQNTYYYYFT